MNLQRCLRRFALLAAIAAIGSAGMGRTTMTMAASFDCAQAKSAQERLICGSADLALLDERGARLYAAALAATSDKNLVKTWQRDWLRSSRSACTGVECLRRVMSLHNRELEEFAQVASAGPTVSGLYERHVRGKPDKHSAQLIVLALEGNRVRIKGNAIWVGNAATGSVHTGEIDGLAQMAGGAELRFDDAYCHLEISIGKNTLTVAETAGSQCGGMNVTFAGEYRKDGATK
jgi:uncharacterized protein